MSDDGDSSIVVIAMLGNVFSPRWARARQRDPSASSLDFSAFNVALRSGKKGCWVLTERGRNAVERSADHLAVGRSDMSWEGDDLVVRVDERSAPWGKRVRGTVRVTPLASSETTVDLDPCGLHTWSPCVPMARVEVSFEEPRLQFSGTGYFDTNQGGGPLEETFSSWSWSRVAGGGRVSLAYDVTLRDGTTRGRSLTGREGRELAHAEAGALVHLPPTRFGLARTARGEKAAVRVLTTLEDGPFYARSVVGTSLDGQRAVGMHETVSLDRFRAGWVRFLVPFRMRVEGA